MLVQKLKKLSAMINHIFFIVRKKPMHFEGKKPNTKNPGTRQPEASQQFENGDMAKEWEELVELDDVQLATIVGAWPGITHLLIGRGVVLGGLEGIWYRW